MKRLILERFAFNPEYTIGRLYLDGKLLFNILEDTDRGLTEDMSEAEIIRYKIVRKTAIPTGTYRIDCHNVSLRFGKKSWAVQYGGRVPLIKSVKGFEGVRIHPGNDADDTEGCLIPGFNTEKGKVTRSQECYHKLMSLIDNDPDITIKIYRTHKVN